MASTKQGADLVERFSHARAATDALCEALSAEDCVAQSMPDASPVKWHLGHTSWFFETFVLERTPGYRPIRKEYAEIFNSYYEAVGPRHPRAARGLLTRPTLAEVRAYRGAVTGRVQELLAGPSASDELRAVIELGVNHEEQHQELLLTDVKHLFGSNPLAPRYREPRERPRSETPPLGFSSFDSGVRAIGHAAPTFAFDNETPAHRVFLEPYALADRLVTNGEYLEFVRDGGYRRPELWLADGFRTVNERGWNAPLYWRPAHDALFSLAGVVPLELADPVCHVSYYEADAFARWANARLASEAEWEAAALGAPVQGNLLESDCLEPRATFGAGGALRQLYGDVWEWTSSAYVPYPGYRPLAGALGEYNGKFMINQQVLRGGSCVTPERHVRATYRNYFPPDARWQFSGIRLARSA